MREVKRGWSRRKADWGEPAELVDRGLAVPVRVAVDEAAHEGWINHPTPTLPIGMAVALYRYDGTHALVVVVNEQGRFLMSGPFHN